MINRLKISYKNNMMWIHLASRILISLILAVGVILIDTRFYSLLDYIPNVFLTSIDLAKVILSTLAGALLNMTTFTFSTIIVVLTMYSSDFSPRVVKNFLTDKITIKVLGVFVGGFFYCILALFFMKKSYSQHLVLSATIGVIYSILCIIYFVIFVYRIAQLIQVSKLIERLYNESYEIIERTLEYREDQVSVDEYALGPFDYNIELISDHSGYLELVEFNDILNILSNCESKLVLNVDIGDFIAKNEILATLYHNEEEVDENIIDKVIAQFSIKEERIAYNDYRFSLQKIVDVALRAISPGINDPNTAVYCINILGVLLSKLGEIKGTYTVFKNDNSLAKIIFQDFNFKEDLYFTFYQIIHYGKTDISVLLSLLNALKVINLSSSDEKNEYIEEFRDYIYENAVNNFSHKLDLDFLKRAKDSV